MASVKARTAQAQVAQYLALKGMPTEEATIVAEHLVVSEAAGYKSHGLMRLERIADLQAGIETTPEVARLQVVASGVERYDGTGQIGIVAVTRAAARLAELVAACGLGAIGVTRYVGTTGRLGHYVDRLADVGLAAIACCTSDYAVAPHGGRRAILGTNPIAVGIPSEGETFVADIATAAMSYGAIKEVEREGGTLPVGVVLDENGRESTDPADADNGAQLPMSGHKGYILGLAVELLAGPLIGAKGGREAVSGSDGTLLIGIRLDAFRDAGIVRQEVGAVLEEIRQSPLAEHSAGIRIPGERSAKAFRTLANNETIEIADRYLELLQN